MSTARFTWVLWCLGWAAVWFFLGLVFILPLLFVPIALACICIPIGEQSRSLVWNAHTNRWE